MNSSSYHSLREQVEGLLTEGRQFGRRAAEWEKVETYWHVGDALTGYLGGHGGTTIGQETIRNLSRDAHLGLTTLYEILRFRRCIPTLYARTNLGWSHYRALIHLPQDRLQHYELLADDEGWTTRQLKRAIEAESDDLSDIPDLQPPETPLRARFGTPFTYRAVTDPLSADAATSLDLGFHHLWNPAGDLAGFEQVLPGDIVRVDPLARTIDLCDARQRCWTYLATVRRLIDGDTLDVNVDMGFGQCTISRLRLRGIDTAELYTQAGRQARLFVEEALADAEHILIATRRTDTYGRYLADVKYLPGSEHPDDVLTQGTYLNRQLLDEGLAQRYLG